MEKLDAIIIGSGFSGIYQLYSLRDKLGLKAKVLDAASGVGGTWFWNRYPGARCDSESHTYMYYFSKDLVNEWEWSERYPQQPEILRYLNFVVCSFVAQSGHFVFLQAWSSLRAPPGWASSSAGCCGVSCCGAACSSFHS